MDNHLMGGGITSGNAPERPEPEKPLTPKPQTPVSLTPLDDSSRNAKHSASTSLSYDPATHLSLSSFDIIRTIGEGSISRVKIAKEKTSEQIVVLKICSKAHLICANEVIHCQNERKALELIHSQWVQQLLGTGQDSKCVFFALEYVQGGELFRLLRSVNKLTLRETEFYAAEVVCALSEIHSWRFVYRDLKPENILITANGHIKLVDMHLAKFLKSDSKTKTLCGTPEYMSPEMVDGSGHSFEADWWQFGILIYELLSSQTPFYDPSPYTLYEKILTEEPRYPGYFSHNTCAFISSLLDKNQRTRLRESKIYENPFFASIDWMQASHLELNPPFIHRVHGPDDDKFFDAFQEGEDNDGEVAIYKENLFLGF